MWKNINIEKCLSHIKRQGAFTDENPPGSRPAITISRMCGAGGRSVASKLAEYLQANAFNGRPWTIFDRSLIEKVLEDHLLPTRLAEYLPESSKSLLAELLDKIRGGRPPVSGMVEQTVETMWRLAESGHVILVGRGGNVVTAGLKSVFHVRLIGSLERRIERTEEVYELSRKDAIAFIKAQDGGRKNYLKQYFGQDVDDPHLYHLVINTDRIAYGDAAKMIGDTVVRWFKTVSAPEVIAA